MNISVVKIVFKYMTGGVESVADYLLGVLNQLLDKIDAKNKTQVTAAFNVAQKVLASLKAFKWLCPTKWQTAYVDTIDAVDVVCTALEDLQLTSDELTKVKLHFSCAYKMWLSPDDDTCVDGEDVMED